MIYRTTILIVRFDTAVTLHRVLQYVWGILRVLIRTDSHIRMRSRTHLTCDMIGPES